MISQWKTVKRNIEIEYNNGVVEMKKKNRNRYTEDQAVRLLSKKHDCKIVGDLIWVLTNGSRNKSNDLGIGSWGKIDYLTNHLGYKRFYTTELPR